MHANASFDYAVIRVVPRVEREEFVNAGIILFSRERRYLACHMQFDEARALALAPSLDVEPLRLHLRALKHVCDGNAEGGPIAALSQSERFHWLTAPRSTIVQPSPVRTGICTKENGGCKDLDSRLRDIAVSMLGSAS